MLNAIEPIIIFQLYKKTASDSKLANIPIAGKYLKNTTAIIPIYLSDSLTGLFIDSESKNIDIDTQMTSLVSGDSAAVNQSALGSTITVNFKARSDSIGLTLLLAIADQLLDKVRSDEYDLTYMHGTTTLFGGLIHGISVDVGGNDDLLKIKLELSKGRPKTKSVIVQEDPNAQRLASTGATPPVNAPTVSAPPSQGSVISPRLR